MKVCPRCGLQYEDSMFFCLEDGIPLRSPADVNLEQTLAMSTIEEATLELTGVSEETYAQPEEPSIGTDALETDSRFRLTSVPKPIPLVDEPQQSFKNVSVQRFRSRQIQAGNLNSLSSAEFWVL